MVIPGTYLEAFFSELHTTSKQALDHLRRTAAPPAPHDWRDARLYEQRINRDGVLFRFVFPARRACG